jgi:cob(I)alamin adenosyltransferase
MSKNTTNLIKRGLVICNIGAGKGKTTAAMGTCVRAAGAGMNVYIMQFVKAKKRDDADRRGEGEWPLSAEIDYLNEVDRVLSDYKKTGGKATVGTIKNEQVGLGFVGILGDKKAKEQHVKAAKEGLKKATQILKSGKWDVVFLDELVSALEVGVLKEADVVKLIKAKPKKVHLILTGHNKYDKVLALCDMITEMKMIQHPYYKGILAQRGIDY